MAAKVQAGMSNTSVVVWSKTQSCRLMKLCIISHRTLLCQSNHCHLSLNREDHWGTTDNFTNSFLHFSLFSTALWDLANFRPGPWFCPPTSSSSLSALSSSPFHYALLGGFGQTWWAGDMTIPLQFASLYDRQIFVWSDCLLDFGTDFLAGNMVSVCAKLK